EPFSFVSSLWGLTQTWGEIECHTPSTGRQRFDQISVEGRNPAGGVEELAEPDGLAAAERPDVDERHVERVAGPLRPPPVAAEHDDLLPRLEELVRVGGELVPPLLVERVEEGA